MTGGGDFEVVETVWITLADGCRVAGRLWLPRPAPPRSLPAILEYLPYRRRDRHRGDDVVTHPYFAARGYAALRVDMRGAGDSDGLMADEYTPREWADALEVIAWLAAQPWCSGAVGLIGLSWSGFNALQIAALAPPALKAVITTCASDDRYADDMHYMGGCLLNDNLQYGATLLTWLATPPDPAIVGDRWRAMWLARLENVAPPAATWMAHPGRDAYWRSGSVAEDYARIVAPVLAVGGWADGYVNAVLRLLEGLPGPRKALIGPWGHAYPHVAEPGPAIDFLACATRWWDHWLKGIDSGIMAEPMVTAWLQQSEPPRPSYVRRRGGWIAEAEWPSPAIRSRRLHLGAAGLTDRPQPADGRQVASPTTVGLASGEWCPYGWGPDMPLDQREDDAGSLVFDGPTLDRPLALLGHTVVELELAADRAQAMIAVRLCDVSPDGVSRRITYGLLDLCHRDGFDRAAPLQPGRRYRVRVGLKDTGYEVPAGHRLRLALSTGYWPLAWPSPEPVCLTIHGGAIDLPERIAGSQPPPPPLGEAVVPPPLDAEILTPPARGRLSIVRDVATGMTEVRVVHNLGAIRIRDVDLELQALGAELYVAHPDDPGATRSEATRRAAFRRGAWQVSVVTRSVLTATAEAFRLQAEIEAMEGERQVFQRRWDLEIPRAGAAGTQPK